MFKFALSLNKVIDHKVDNWTSQYTERILVLLCIQLGAFAFLFLQGATLLVCVSQGNMFAVIGFVSGLVPSVYAVHLVRHASWRFQQLIDYP